MGETGHDLPDMNQQNPLCQVFKAIKNTAPFPLTGVSYRNNLGAFCLEKTVYEVANLISRISKQNSAVPCNTIFTNFEQENLDHQFLFNKFAKFASQARFG